MERFLNRKMGLAAIAAAVTLAVGLACSGAGGAANQAACKKWVETQNALPCMKTIQQDANQMCPEQLDMQPLDMTEYYGCMEKNAKCNGDIPDLAGQVSCKPPTH